MRPLDSNICIAPDTDALRQMFMADMGRLLVMKRNTLVGLISRSAIARFLLLAGESGLALSVGQEFETKRHGPNGSPRDFLLEGSV